MHYYVMRNTMRAKLIIIVALLTAPAAHAKNIALCVAASELAETVMSARQSGVSLMKLIQFAQTNKDESLRKFEINLAQEAFRQPRYRTLSNQKRAIVDFGSEQMGRCLEAITSSK